MASKHTKLTVTYIQDQQIDPAIAERILYFLNKAEMPSEIAGFEPVDGPVLDSPEGGGGGFDIGLKVAERILLKRPEDGFTSLEQLANIPYFGVDKFNDLVFTAQQTGFGMPAPVPVEVPDQSEDLFLESLSKKELMALAAQQGLTFLESFKKWEMVQLLKAQWFGIEADFLIPDDKTKPRLQKQTSSQQLVTQAIAQDKPEAAILKNLSLKLPESTNPVHFSKVVGMEMGLLGGLSSIKSKSTHSDINKDEDRLKVKGLIPKWTHPKIWGVLGDKVSEFNHISHLSVDDSGNLYVTDEMNHRIQKFDNNGIFLRMWGDPVNPSQGKPYIVFYISLNKMLLSSFGANIHRITDLEGNLLFQVQPVISEPNGSWMTSLQDACSDRQGNVFYIDPASSNSGGIYKFHINSDTKSWDYIGHQELKIKFRRHGLSIMTCDNLGNVYVAHNAEFKIYKFSNDLTLINSWGQQGMDNGSFEEITGIAVDKHGFVYVSDFPNQQIIAYSPEGEYVTSWRHLPNQEEENVKLIGPYALSYHPNEDRLYIVDGHELEKIIQIHLEYEKITAVEEGDDTKSITSIDFRAENWLYTWKKLDADLDIATRRYNRAKRAYEKLGGTKEDVSVPSDAISSLSEDPVISPMEIENAEAAYKRAMERNLQAELMREQFLSFLISQGIKPNNEEAVLQENNVETALRSTLSNNRNVLNNLKVQISEESVNTDVREYVYQDGQYIDQYGIPLDEHVLSLREKQEAAIEHILIIPVMERANDPAPERVVIVRNPEFSGQEVHPLSILFEEEFVMDVRWMGIGLGEFSHSVNLFPGEQREIKIVSSKKRSWETTIKTSELSKASSSSESAYATKRNDSFENALQSSFEDARSLKFAREDERSTSNSFSASANASASFGFGSGSASSNVSMSSKMRMKQNISTSLASVAKNARQMASKASSEVSENNKVSFTSSTETSQQLEKKIAGEDHETETTTITISNINEGKTVNYNFYQVTNIYATNLRIDDLKVHINTGIEIIPGTKITFAKSYDIEHIHHILHDFRLYALPDRKKIVAAIMVQVFKDYLYIQGDPLGDEPRLVQIEKANPAFLRDWQQQCLLLLDRLAPGREVEDFKKAFEGTLYHDIMQLSREKWKVEGFDLGQEDFFVVNSGKYYVDAAVGLKPATEEYLENRRQIETERQQALVEELKERTKKGVFYPDLPDSLTHLNMDEIDGTLLDKD